MQKGKRRVAFIISIVAMALCAVVAAAGAVIYFANAAVTFVLPLSLFIAGLSGVIVCMCVAFAVIPKNAETLAKSRDKKCDE